MNKETEQGWEQTTTQKHSKKHPNSQAELLYLFLNHPDLLDRWLLTDEVEGVFSEANQVILDQLIIKHGDGFSLSRKGFTDYIKTTYSVPKERIEYEVAIDRCWVAYAKPSDYPVLIKTLIKSRKISQHNMFLELSKGKSDKERAELLRKAADALEVNTDDDKATADFDKLMMKQHKKYANMPHHAFPDVVRKYAENKAEQIGVPFEFLAPGILSVMAGAVGTTVGINPWQQYKEPCCLWFVCLAKSGERKTAGSQAVMAITKTKREDVQRTNDYLTKQYRNASRKYKGAMKKLEAGEINEKDLPEAPQLPRLHTLVLGDTTYETAVSKQYCNPRGMMVYRPELFGWIETMNQYKGGGGGEKTYYLESWDGDEYRYSRKTDGDLVVDKNLISIFGYSQPHIFKAVFSNERNIQDGFASRFLIATPPVNKSKGNKDLETDAESFYELQRVYGRFVDWQPEFAQEDEAKRHAITDWVKLTPAAERMHSEWLNKWTDFKNDYLISDNVWEQDNPITPYWSKASGQMLRLMLIIHLIRYEAGETTSEQVDTKSWNMAKDLTMYFICNMHTTLQAKSAVNASQYENQFEKLAKKCKANNGSMNVRQITRSSVLGQNLKKQAVLDILNAFVEDGKGYWDKENKEMFHV